MAHVRGVNRSQSSLFPESLDDFIGPDHVVRLIDGFVSTLDLVALGFAKAVPARTGRPPYDPADLLKLYIYGYMSHVRSSRRLERESQRNIELLWLLHRVSPDHKTIANFRRANGEAIGKLTSAFVRFCREASLLGDLVAIDGSRFAASNALDRVVKRQEVARELERVQAYLEGLEQADAAEVDLVEGVDVAAATQALQALKQRGELEALLAQMDEAGSEQLGLTDTDARKMPVTQGGGFQVGYNVQVAVDTQTHLIVHEEVTDAVVDRGQLKPMVEGIRRALEHDAFAVVADAGYSKADDAAHCEALGITTYVSREHGVNRHGLFDKRAFVYEAEADRYRCPAGQYLAYQGTNRRDRMRQYRATRCRGCPLKAQCTTARVRTVVRHEEEAALERMDRRARDNPQVLRRRKATVEHVFGTLKSLIPRFVMRGRAHVNTEISLAALAYNLKRMMVLRGAAAFHPA